MDVMQSIELEWLILADAAQVIDGKLYLMGGGWDVLTVNSGFPFVQNVALAVAFRVPWNETNQRHNIEIVIADQDGAQLAKVEGELEVGRPAGIAKGQDQRVQMALPIPLKFDGPNTYVVVASVDGKESGRVRFNIVTGPMLAIRQQGDQGTA